MAAVGVECQECGRTVKAAGTGRPKRFCGQTCRKRASRRPNFPPEMTDRTSWVRCVGKRPLTVDGGSASSADATTWSSFSEVQVGPGNGFGIMLGGGLGCYDLDSVSDESAARFIGTIVEPVVFVERSVSGKGVHVFVRMPESRGSVLRRADGSRVERYSFGRFIRTTGIEFKV